MKRILELKLLKLFLLNLKKQNQNMFLTIKEKRELVLKGEDVPICVAGKSEVDKKGIVKHNSIYNKNKKLDL